MLGQIPWAGLEIRLFGRRHGGHLFHILGVLILNDVHDIIHGDEADQPPFTVYNRHMRQVVFTEIRGDLFLILQRARHGGGRVLELGDLP